MGPVRIGNQAYHQVQNDVYGAAILAATHAFFDRRHGRCAGHPALFERLEELGEQAIAVYDQPDAGLWELREPPGRPHLLGRDVLGRLRPPGADRRRAGPARARG